MSTPTQIISEQTKRPIKSQTTIEVPAEHTRQSVTHLAQPTYQLGDLLVGYLEQLGVEYVFGIPGGAIEPLYDALARSERRGRGWTWL